MQQADKTRKNHSLALRLVIIFATLIATFLLLGLIAYVMPDAPTMHHAKRTIDRGDLCIDYPQAIMPRMRYRQDNFTDALIVNQAINLRHDGIKGILLLPRAQDTTCQTISLNNAVHGTAKRYITYPRYWHGSTFVTRILLTFCDYPSIRYLLYIVSSFLLIATTIVLWRRGWKAEMLAFAYSLMMVNVVVMQYSMQFAPVLLIATGAILWLARHKHTTHQQLACLFFIVGSLTAYFDLITVPSITLGLPLAILIATDGKHPFSFNLRRIINITLIWLIGYAATWLAKWTIGTLLTDENVFASAMYEADYWASGNNTYIWQAIQSNTNHLRWVLIVLPIIPLCIAAAIWPQHKAWPTAVALLVVALIPIGYYIVMAHAAHHHNWFNYRAMATFIAALFMAISAMVDWQQAKQKIRKIKNHTS